MRMAPAGSAMPLSRSITRILQVCDERRASVDFSGDVPDDHTSACRVASEYYLIRRVKGQEI